MRKIIGKKNKVHYVEETTRFQMVKSHRGWLVIGASMFALGLGVLVTSRPVSADVAATSTSSSAVRAETTSASSSSATKADSTSASSSSAVKTETTSASSSSATKADSTSASSSSAVKTETTNASSSSATKTNSTSASSSSAVKTETTSASSSSAVKAETTDASSSSATKADSTSASSSSAMKADSTSASSSSATKADSANATSTNEYSASASNLSKTGAASTSNSTAARSSRNRRSVDQPMADYATAATTEAALSHVDKANFLEYFSLNGSATYDAEKGIVTITPEQNNQVGNFSLTSKIDMNKSFTLTGQVNLGSHPDGADGIGFAFHSGNTTDVGNAGGNLGIGGLQDAIGFKLDTWFNRYQAPLSNKNGSEISSTDSNGFGWNGDSANAPYGTFVETNNKEIWTANGSKVRPWWAQDNGPFPYFGVNHFKTINQEIWTANGSKVQRWWAQDTGNPQALSKADIDGLFHDFVVNYDGATRALTVSYKQASRNVLTWTTKVDSSDQAMSMIVSASTGAANNLQQFRLKSFHFQAAATVNVKYVDTTGHQLAQGTVNYPDGAYVNGRYTTKQLAIPNYRFIKMDDKSLDANGTLTHAGDNGTVIYVYAPAYVTTESKTVNETVRYVDQNGHGVAKPHTDSVNFTRTVVVDNVTGEVITIGAGTTAWTAKNGDTTFDAVVSPVVSGSVANKAQIAAVTDLNADSANVTETVTYTKVGSLVPSSSDGHFPRVPTVVYPNDPSDATKVTPAGVPTVPGYTAHDPEGHVLTPGSRYQPSDPTKDTTITYTADKQKGSVSYVDDTTGKILKTDPISGTTGSKSSYSTSGNIADYKKQGYELVTDGYPADLTFDNDDTTAQNFTVHLKHQNIQSTEAKTVTETIHYQGAGNQTPADNTAQVTFTRQVSTDTITGEKTYGSWSAYQSFAAVTSPVIKGYTPDQAEIGAQTVSGDASDLDFTVIYTKDAPTKPVNPSQPTTPAKPVQAGQAAATNFVDQRLPQTGETDQQHMTLSGLLLLAMSSVLGLFGMTKRQRKE